MKLARVYKRKRKNKPFEVKYYDKDGKRSSLSFQNKLEADSFASECNNECKLPAQLQFSTEERIEFAKFREIATAKGITLVDAIKKCLDMLKGINPAQKISVSDLRKEYLRDCAKRKMRKRVFRFMLSPPFPATGQFRGTRRNRASTPRACPRPRDARRPAPKSRPPGGWRTRAGIR